MEEQGQNQDPLLNYTPPAPAEGVTVGQTLGDAIRAKYPVTSHGSGKPQVQGSVDAFDSPIIGKEPERHQVSFKDYSMPFSDIYKQMGDGSFQATIPNFIQGTNNYERLAQEQSAGEQWANGLYKNLVLKTGTAALGGTVGFVSGIFNSVKEGSFSAMYTDDFNNMLDVYNEKLEYTLPNYVTAEQQEMGFFESMSTVNFYAQDLAGGLSFTLGAIVSEGIWALATGGTSLIAKGLIGNAARWSSRALGTTKSLNALAKFKAPTMGVINGATKVDDVARLGSGALRIGDDVAKVGTGVARLGDDAGRAAMGMGDDMARAGEAIIGGAGALNKGAAIKAATIFNLANQARFIATSAGYEAGVEARHYLKEVEEEWNSDFQERYGRKPNATELAEFKVGLTDSGNAVYLANMAIVGSSNMAIWGKMLLGKSTKSAFSNSLLKKELFGVGYTMKNGVATAVKASVKQKVAGSAYGILRPVMIEGVWEEGGQSVASKTVKDYMLAPYREDFVQANYGLMSSLMEGFKQTYGTKEGRKEVGIGMIIGLFGGGLTSRGKFNDVSKERKNIVETVKFRNEFSPDRVLAAQITATRMMASSRMMHATAEQAKAKENGDYTGEFLSEQQAILASIERDASLQGTKQGLADFEAYLNTIADTELASELGINESEVSEWKNTKREEYADLSAKYQENEKYIRAIVGDKNFAGTSAINSTSEQVIKALTYNLTIGEQSHAFTKKIIGDIKATIGGEFDITDVNSILDLDLALAQASVEKVKKYTQVDAKYKNLVDQRTKIENELVSAQYNKGASTPEQHSAKLGKLQERLIEFNKRIEEVSQEKEVLFSTLGIQNELFTKEDLDSQSQRVADLQRKVDGYKDTNIGLHTTLTKLFAEYNKSKSNTISFHNLSKELLDPKIRIDVINGWMSSILKKNKNLDEYTKEFFMAQLEQYETNNVQGKVFSGEAVNDRTQTEPEEEVSTEDSTTKEEGDEMVAPTPEETTKKVPTPIEMLKQKIADIMGKNVYTTTYIGENFDEAVKTRPDKTDVSRYEEILGKINSTFIEQYNQLMNAPKGYFKSNKIETGLTVEELEELKELQKKLSNWKVLEGSTDAENTSVADLMFMIEQLQTEVEKADTKEETTSEEYAKMKQAPEAEATENSETAEAVQSPDQVVVRLVEIAGEAIYSFSHLDIRELSKLFPESSVSMVNGKISTPLGEVKPETLAKNMKQEGQRFSLTVGDNTITVKIGVSSRVNINKKELDSVLGSSNIMLIKYGSGNYTDVYKRLSNGDLVPLQGDFTYSSALADEIIELLPEVINNIKEGQILITRINRNDSFNKTLIEAYEKSKKTDTDYNTLMNELHIYVTDQTGQVVGSLRATKADLGDNAATKSLLELRRKAATMIMDEANGAYFSLNETIPVKTALIGSPNFVMTDKEGVISPTPIDITTTALNQIEDVGYFEGKELKLRNMDGEKVIKTFLPKNSTKKMPVGVIKLNGKLIAFPLTLKATSVDKVSQIDEILATDLNMSQKMTKINAVLIENGLKPADFAQVEGDNIGIDINKVRENLSSVKVLPNLADWIKSSYKLETLKSEAQIAIDLDNKPFHLSKIILDMSKTKTIGRTDQVRAEYDSIESREIKITNSLRDFGRTIRKAWNSYYVSDTQFTDILDEAGIDSFDETESYLRRMEDVKLLRQLSSVKKIPKEVLAAHKEGFFENLKESLLELDRITELKKKVRSDIKDSKTAKAAKNENTEC